MLYDIFSALVTLDRHYMQYLHGVWVKRINRFLIAGFTDMPKTNLFIYLLIISVQSSSFFQRINNLHVFNNI